MRCPKSVTSSKVEANRQNAKHSTGPRTGRGKRNSRFNAVTLGLFAKHVVIPICDGYKPENEFRALLDGLHQEFQPVGLYEEWLVVKVAECMWRLRRATRCESGSVRQSAIWNDRTSWEDRLENQRAMVLLVEVWALEPAENELRDSGSLSQENYQKVLPLVEAKRERAKSERLVETDFDREEFLTCITGRKESLELKHRSVCSMQDERSDAASTTTLSYRKVTWKESFATKRECTDTWIGQWKDSWRVRKDKMQNEANKWRVFNSRHYEYAPVQSREDHGEVGPNVSANRS